MDPIVTVQELIDALTTKKNETLGNTETYVVLAGVGHKRILMVDQVTEADTKKLLIYLEE